MSKSYEKWTSKGRRSYRRRKGEALILDKVREYEALDGAAQEKEQSDPQSVIN